MKVLVTGGAGFIGSHVVDLYADAGHEVVVVDNLSSGRRDYVHPGARFHQLDIRDPTLRDAFAAERPEVVNHHAAHASVTASVVNPRLDADINVMGTIHLLMLCAEFGVKKFVFASTGGAIYGNPDQLPVGEMYPARPLAPYGASKLAAEGYVRLFGAPGMRWAVLRYSNVYGPRQDPLGEAGVVAIFSRAMLSGKRPTIYGDGTQTRDFVYVEDVAWANLLATAAETSDLTNIGTGTETTVNEIFRHLAEATQFPHPPAYAPPRPGEVQRIALDPRHAERWLGWKASTPLAEGLKRTVEWFRASSHPLRGK